LDIFLFGKAPTFSIAPFLKNQTRKRGMMESADGDHHSTSSQGPQGLPTGVAEGLLAGARTLVEVLPTLGTQTGTVRLTQRARGQSQKDVLTHHFKQVNNVLAINQRSLIFAVQQRQFAARADVNGGMEFLFQCKVYSGQKGLQAATTGQFDLGVELTADQHPFSGVD